MNTPTTMAQTARMRGRDEAGSVCWNSLVAGFSICGRPGYWRMFDNAVPVGQKAGGFVKDVAVKEALTALYRHELPFVEVKAQLTSLLSTLDFQKQIVR